MAHPEPARTALALAAAALVLGVSIAPGQAQAAPNAPAPAAATTELRKRVAALDSGKGASLPAGAKASLALQLDVAERIARDFAPQSEAWRKRAARMLDAAERGEDPFVRARGQIVMRGYDSPVSRVRQGYSIYLPDDYDPARAYPLIVVLHGGSANGNLFLGVVLGNNMNWKLYDQHLWDEFSPRWHPNAIVVAPDGFGQVMWRFMGEQDVLDVIADVQQHYRVDEDRVSLLGLSNGGVGAYMLGMRYAWRFSTVSAIAGAPSWLQYAGGKIDLLQAEALHPISGMSLAENAIDTDFRYFHGRVDPGPMRPAFVEAFGKHIATLGVPYKERWFDLGHDLLYPVLRYGKLLDELGQVVRNRKPKEVRVVTGDYRANRQHWVTVTRIADYPRLARVRAVVDGSRVRVETSNVEAFTLDLATAPLTAAGNLGLDVDGQVVFDGAREKVGSSAAFVREAGRWKLGAPRAASLEKKPGLAGPITDAYFGSMLHVYGTQDPAQTEALKKTAQRGARGWPLWLWRVDQQVVADTEVTDAMLKRSHVVLYATPGSNSLLERIADRLPIRITKDAVLVGDQRYASAGVGTKLVYPNPLAPERYVIVQAAPTLAGVSGGHQLPDFLPDYVVYDAKTTQTRPRLLFDARKPPLALGYFDRAWRIDPGHTLGALRANASLVGNDPESAALDRPASRLPVPQAPALPALPTTFATDASTPTGKVAREIARRVQTFTNYRSKIPGATWSTSPGTWSIREPEACLRELEQRGVHAKPWTKPLPTPVPVPVRLEGPVAGVEFRMMHAGAGGVVSCELAARLPAIAEIVKRHGVHTVYVLSAYRDHPYTSFHTLGLGLDLARFDTDQGPLIVKTDFKIDHSHETCASGAEPTGEKARTLRAIACDLASSGQLSSVLTPNYNVGHRDHFHLDVRPDDPRLFLR